MPTVLSWKFTCLFSSITLEIFVRDTANRFGLMIAGVIFATRKLNRIDQREVESYFMFFFNKVQDKRVAGEYGHFYVDELLVTFNDAITRW